MTIKWLAQACIIVKQQAAGSGKLEAAIVMDPYGEGIGFRLPKLEPSVVTVSHDHFDHNNVKALGGSPFVVSEPGEYEVSGFSLSTIPSFHDANQGTKRGSNLIVKVYAEGFSLAHFGDFGQEELSAQQLEALGEVDIAFLPVGGFYTIDGARAAHLANQLEPKVVAPIHYALPGLTIKELAGPEDFFKAMGQRPIVIEGDWKVKASDLPGEGTRVVQLVPQGIKSK